MISKFTAVHIGDESFKHFESDGNNNNNWMHKNDTSKYTLKNK